MKISVNWLILALSFVCLQATKAQVNLSLNSTTPQYIAPSKSEMAHTTNSKEVMQPVLLSDILTDTLGNKPNANNIKNKGGKSTATPFDVVIDAAIEGWDAVFKTEKVKMNAFSIDTVIDMRIKETPNLSLKNREIPQPVESPVHVESFDFAAAKMTVKMVNGQFVEFPKNDSVAQVGKGIVENVFKIDVDEEVDASWLKSSSFVHNGEVYTKMTEAELESILNTPRTKKVKEKRPRVSVGHFIYSSEGTETANSFIDEYEDEARSLEKFGIPYAICMSMAILESRHGASYLTSISNNLFSIKDKGGDCKDESHRHVKVTDDRRGETFHVFNTFQDAFIAYKDFLIRNDRYDKCFRCGNDIECWLYRIGRSGYATDPQYPYMLADVINKYKLTDSPIRYNQKKIAQRLK